MMSPFSSDTSTSPTTPRRLARYGLYLVGAMVLLWMIARAVAVQPSPSPPESQSTDSTRVASSSTSGSASGIDVFSWGNVAAFLLLAAGGAYALYLRQNGSGTESSTPFRPLGQLTLGQSQDLRLVACGGEVLLLGVTDDEITLLKTYPVDAFEPPDADATAEDRPPSTGELPNPPDTQPASFSDVLTQFARRDDWS